MPEEWSSESVLCLSLLYQHYISGSECRKLHSLAILEHFGFQSVENMHTFSKMFGGTLPRISRISVHALKIDIFSCFCLF